MRLTSVTETQVGSTFFFPFLFFDFFPFPSTKNEEKSERCVFIVTTSGHPCAVQDDKNRRFKNALKIGHKFLNCILSLYIFLFYLGWS